MFTKLSSIKINGLFGYLITRANLRFFPRLNNHLTLSHSITRRIIDLDPRDLEQKYLAADCIREPENLLIYRAIASSQLVTNFIDIGANCGHVALSIINYYEKILLIEPNPKLAELLRKLFEENHHVKIKECAIVDASSVGSLTLTVPDISSGLATLGVTRFISEQSKVQFYDVKASTLEKEIGNLDLSVSYIKIDVEGLEAKIISSMRSLINQSRPIVGFEALSLSAALNCASYFERYIFYCARFNFLENGGALSRSKLGLFSGLIFGSQIEFIKLNISNELSLDNFSQIFAIPVEKSELFEKSVINYMAARSTINLNGLKTWSMPLTDIL